MPFKKINLKKEIEKRTKENPQFADEYEKAKKEYENIKLGKLNKKFGVD